ncbi:M23 family metallopeptidase [Geomicrobium sediminis]|uniref:Stage IV sporulation protein FA n=1 Tax=Geomicrobium sediminis TaxID=1347788 RepID=A0ABS2P9Z0_9BACL|nr:M23 family metallopeptidase [Geomicrobium sediminis]MBM7631663.1 stage IV sporulation protein FA [Geomicrobium sediminis]
MGDQLDRIRKEAEKKRKKETTVQKAQEPKKNNEKELPLYSYYPSREEMNEHEPEFYMWRNEEISEAKQKKKEKVKQRFFIQWVAALGLFLITAIVVQADHPSLNETKQTALSLYQDEFQFAAVSSWYEEQFGHPLALLPANPNVTNEEPSFDGYAMPAAGEIQVTETFSENGQAIVVETMENAAVTAVRPGVVIRAGENEGFGQTIVIQHEDGTEAMYGSLQTIDVHVYDHVAVGDSIGTVSSDNGGGQFMFGLRSDDEFIDPSEVMTFD